MALTIARFKDQRVQIASAGIPYALVYRAATGEVEEVMLKAMPLGSFADFQYQQKEFHLQEGDAVLLMSDGYSEMFNPHGEMLGDEPAETLFAETAHQSPAHIIAGLLERGSAWAAGRAQNDEVTFMVIKVK